MYSYVEDKPFLTDAKRTALNIMKQLTSKLRDRGLDCNARLLGLDGKELILQNGNNPVEIEYLIEIEGSKEFDLNDGHQIKLVAMDEIDIISKPLLLPGCVSNTFNIILPQLRFSMGSTEKAFSIVISIVHEDPDGSYGRLGRKPSAVTARDQWSWIPVPDSIDLNYKAKKIRNKYWKDVNSLYLKKKNAYLTRVNIGHPSFVCYVESVNEVYRLHFEEEDEEF